MTSTRISTAAAVHSSPPDEGPALTMIGVTTLPEADMLVALDGVAMLRGTIPDRTRDPEAGTR